MFGRVAKIPIANKFGELVEMDFVDYGGYATFLHIQDTFSRFTAIIFWHREKGRTNGINDGRKCDCGSDGFFRYTGNNDGG